MKVNFIKSKFLQQSVIYGVAGAISKFSAFFTVPIYTKLLSIEQFGLYDFYISIGMLFYILLETQMMSGIMRGYYEKKQKNKLRYFIGSVLSYYIVVDAIAILILAAAYFFNLIAHSSIENYYLPLILMVFPRQFFDISCVIMRMEEKAKHYLIYNCGNIFLISICGIISICYISSSVPTLIWAMCFGYYVSGIAAFIFIYNTTGFVFNLKYFQEVFLYSLPIVPAVLGGWGMTSIGKVFVKAYLPSTSLGIYALALKISMIYLMFVQAFKLTWQPYAIKKFTHNPDEAKNTFSNFLTGYLVCGAVLIALIYVISPMLIKIVASKKYLDSKNYILIIMLTYYYTGAINIIAIGNSWVRKTYYNSFGSVLGGGSH